MFRVRRSLIDFDVAFAAIAARNGHRSRTSCSQSMGVNDPTSHLSGPQALQPIVDPFDWLVVDGNRLDLPGAHEIAHRANLRRACPLRISVSIGCDTQMREGLTPIYWTMVSSIPWRQSARQARSHFRSNQLLGEREPRRAAHRQPVLREACPQTRVTHDDGTDFSSTSGRSTLGNCGMSWSAPLFSRRGDRLRLATDRHQSMIDVRP